MSVEEWLSRSARNQIFECVARVVGERVQAERQAYRMRGKKLSPGRAPILKKVSEVLNVSLPTVKAWRRGDWQSCNVNTKVLLKVAKEMCPKNLEAILSEDLQAYNDTIHELLFKKEE